MRTTKLLRTLELMPRIYQAKVSLANQGLSDKPLPLLKCGEERVPLSLEEATIKVTNIYAGYVKWTHLREPISKVAMLVESYTHAHTNEVLIPYSSEEFYSRHVLNIVVESVSQYEGQGRIEGGPILLKGKETYQASMRDMGILYLPVVKDSYIVN